MVRVPSLPDTVIFENGNTTIQHLYHGAQEHANPIHYHVYENNTQIAKIKTDGTVISGKLNKQAQEILSNKQNTNILQKTTRRISNYIKKVKNSVIGNQPYREGKSREANKNRGC